MTEDIYADLNARLDAVKYRKYRSVVFGALAPPLAEQFPELPDLGHFQQDADAITRLSIRGLLTEGEVNRARKRLFRKLCRQAALKDPQT